MRSSDYFELTELAERGMLPSQLSDMMEGGAVSMPAMPAMPAGLPAGLPSAKQVVSKGARIFKKKLAQD